MTNSRQQDHRLKIQRGTHQDLRNAFLAVHASSIVMDIPELAADLNIKRQYAKELMETLTKMEIGGNPLVHINARVGEAGNDGAHDLYSTFYTSDDKSSLEMEQLFDKAFPAPTEPIATNPKVAAPRTPRSATPPPNPADLPLCMCGCEFPVTNRKRNYKPGHDARHAGRIAREVAAGGLRSLIGELPTQPLRNKAEAMADRLIAKAGGKSTPVPGEDPASHQPSDVPLAEIVAKVSKEFIKPVEFISGEVKIGRWKYPAEKNSTSGSVAFTRKGKTEVADAKVAATFDPQVIVGDGSKSEL